MNTIWSDNIQGIKTLYLSRQIRFHDWFRPQYQDFFQIPEDAKCRILEIGCGPGALAGAMHRWYPRAEIVGIDRDSRFIAFARQREPELEWIEGDAAALPFADGWFDITISHTVQEHIEPSAFWGEQRRVLRTGGACLCLSSRKGICHQAACLAPTPEEIRFWDSIPEQEAALQTYGVGKYRCSESELPLQMEAYGFRHVTAGYAVIDLTPDNPKYPHALAEQMIEAERQSDMEAVLSTRSDETAAVIAAIDKKYDTRLQLYREGVHQWDTQTSLIMMLRGEK